jgi:DNA-binding CsgD family transcriptional regulator
MLVGRKHETEILDRLLAGASTGESGVLVITGEPGVGKTALINYAVGSASGFRIARAVGLESEGELAFAALHQLCAPLLDRLDRLPQAQRDALGAVFGLSAGTAPEPFLTGLAVLSLLSSAAEEQPLLCLVDDAQWLDRASAQVLGFVARRLLADPIAMIFATRVPTPAVLDGLPELVVGGLTDVYARQLLVSALKVPLEERVLDRIVGETHGNPLALLELPRGRTAAELAVGFGGAAAVPVTRQIEQSVRRRADQLPAETRRLLLVAAADQVADHATVRRAAERLEVGAAAAAPAVAAGLVDVDPELVFRHPLVRSAIYGAAPLEERRAVHRALAEETDREVDPDRRAWHLAAAASWPDEAIAAELEQSAGRAQMRGGLSAAAAFLDRAAELTADPQQQALRLLLAAGAHVMAGENEQALDGLRASARHLEDPAARAQAKRIDGAIRFADGRGGDTPSLLFEAAMGFRDLDVRLARETLLECFESAYWAAQLTTGTTMVDVAEAARALPAPEGDETVANLLLTGYTERLTTGFPAAVPWWRRAAEAHPGELERERRLHWEGLVWNVTGEMLDYEAHKATAGRWVAAARKQGALATLPVALSGLAWCEVLGGRLDAAQDLNAQAEEITAATGAPEVPGAAGILLMGLLAWRGREETRAAVEAVSAEAIRRGQGLGVPIGQYALTLLELGQARYDDARTSALKVFAADPLYFGSIHLGDVVEATVRSRDTAGAEAALARLAERAEATKTPWALGLLARSRALMADSADAEPHYLQAIEQLARSALRPELGRAHLLYGEWLRRQRRRRDAREHLRAAYEMLDAMGIAAFAQRARVELMATGERARARVAETRDQITPQEHQVARLAADGDSNAEIAAQLFISPHTVAYHLRKVFAKLGIRSRSQLGAALPAESATTTVAR